MDKLAKVRAEVKKLSGNPYYMIAVKDALAINKKTTAKNYQYGNRQLSVWKSTIISMEINNYQYRGC